MTFDKTKLLLIILFTPFLFLSTINVQAQLVECNGIWTNTSCPTKPNKSILEQPTSSRTTPSSLKQKQSLLHKLTMKQLKARNDYNLDFDISSTENLCLDPAVTLGTCSEKIDQTTDRLDQQIIAQETLKLKKQKLEQQNNQQPTEAMTNLIIVHSNKHRHQRKLWKEKEITDQEATKDVDDSTPKQKPDLNKSPEKPISSQSKL